MNWEQYAKELEKLISSMDESPTKILMTHLAREAKEKARITE